MLQGGLLAVVCAIFGIFEFELFELVLAKKQYALDYCTRCLACRALIVLNDFFRLTIMYNV